MKLPAFLRKAFVALRSAPSGVFRLPSTNLIPVYAVKYKDDTVHTFYFGVTRRGKSLVTADRIRASEA